MADIDLDDPWLTAKQVAEYFNVTVGTVKDWIKNKGTLHGVLLNGRWRVRKSEVARLANEMFG